MRVLLFLILVSLLVGCTLVEPRFATDIALIKSLNTNVGIYYEDGKVAGYWVNGLVLDNASNPVVFEEESLDYRILIFQPGTDAFTADVYQENSVVHSYDELSTGWGIPFSIMNISADSDRRFDVLLQVELPTGKVFSGDSYAYELPSFE